MEIQQRSLLEIDNLSIVPSLLTLRKSMFHAGDFFGHMRPKSFISLGFYRSQLKLCSETKLFLLYNLADLDF